MNSTIPAEVLALKSHIDQWRAKRSHIRERMPTELREAIVKLAQQYSPALIRRLFKIDPWRINGSITAKPAPAQNKPAATFFELPISAPAPVSTTNDAPGCRLQLERPDGARLTLTLPALDLGLVRAFCVDFLRDNKQ